MAESITLARPYAKAAFEVAVADKTLDEWSEALSVLAAVTADDKIAILLASPTLSAEKQSEALVGVCGDKVSDKAANLVRLLAENRRLLLFAEISAGFETLKAEHLKAIEVELISAFELSEEVVEQLSKALHKRLDREIALTRRVDRHLIGGAVIRAGDTVIDNSVRGKLKKLAESMNS